MLLADLAQTQRRFFRCCYSVLCRRIELASCLTHYDAAIPAVDIEYCFSTTYPDPLSTLLDFRLGYGRVRCVALCWGFFLVRLADSHIVRFE